MRGDIIVESNFILMKLFGCPELPIYESPFSKNIIDTFNITDRFYVDVSRVYWTLGEVSLYKVKIPDDDRLGYVQTDSIRIA